MSIYDHNNKKKKPQTTTNRNMVIYIYINTYFKYFIFIGYYMD